MQKNKSASNNKENMSSLMAQEEHFVAAGEIKKDLNAVYIEDNPQKALEKLLNLAKNSNFQEKLQYIKHLAELLDLIGDEAINNLKQIIGFVKTDRDEVKRAFMSQTTALVSALQKRGDRGYQEIVNVVLPVVSDFLNAPQYEMKEEAGRLLTKIGKILNEDDKGKHILTRVLGLAHDDENEENRTIAARLLSQMAPLFGKDLCEQFVGFEFLAMGDDPQFRVRKEAVSNLPSIGKVVSPQFFKQKLMPFYLKACRDSNWGVRLACVENLFDISQICRSELVHIREVELTEVILNFLKDANKGVKVGAYKVLGKFISTLHGHKIDPRLIDNFMKMADSAVNNLSGDNEIIHACAYNFPAVVYTLGASKWPFLLKLFQTLLKSTDSVRRPLAYSLHDIAKIIGEERAEKDLYQVLVKFLQDKNDDIKYGAIQNLALFFKVFRIEKREHMIDLLLSIQKDQKKWRIRELVAKQIEQLTLIFPPEISFQIIAPISFKLCNDPFATVREEAAKHIYALLRSLSDSEEIYRLSVIETVKGFSVSNRFTNRQAYVTMCQNLMKDPELFKTNFLESLIPLANDKVPNVRIALAKALLKLHKRKSPLAEDPQIKQLYKKLKGDSSKDVKSLLSTIPEDAPAKQSSPKNTEIASASTAAQVTESSSTVVETSATENNSEDVKEEKVEQKEEVLVQEEKAEQKEEAPIKEEIAEQKEEVLAKEEEAEQKAEEEVVESKEENNVEQKAEEEVVQNKEEEKVEECQPQEAEAEGEVSNKIEEQAKQEDIVV